MRWDREGDWEATERDLKAALGALGRTYGLLWLVVSAGLVIAAWRYGRGELLIGRIGTGVTVWGLVFVAVPAYRTVSRLYRLYDHHLGGPTVRLVNHRWLAGIGIPATGYTAVALWMGWPAAALLVGCPLGYCWSCWRVVRNSSPQ